VVRESARKRERVCPVGSGCSTLELQGSVNCGPDEYEAQAPTLTSHRGCAPVTTCKAVGVEWEVSRPTALVDRVCQAVTVCTPGAQYETRAPTASTDRACADLTQCAEGLFVEVIQPTATTDRSCRRCEGTECRLRHILLVVLQWWG
jgi:hypothetical protein